MSTYGPRSTAAQIAADFKDSARGKNVLVTGVSVGGLGFETIRSLAPYAGLIIAAGRSKERVLEAINQVKKETPEANIRPLLIDLGSIASIRRAAAEIEYDLPLHILINNAANFNNPTVSHTIDGFETNLGTNHIGPSILTNLLHPNLRRASASDLGPARVVNVSSKAHEWVQAPGVRYDDPHYTSDPASYEKFQAYGYSKMANILHAQELALRWKKDNILAYSLHPGMIMTPGAQKIPKEEFMAFGVMTPEGEFLPGITKTLEEGAATTVFAALSPSIAEQSGAYLDDAKLAPEALSPLATPDNAERFWMFTEELIQNAKQASRPAP